MEPRVLTVILTVNQSRCIQLMNQFKEIKYPFPVKHFFGFTPKTSTTYIQDKDPLHPEFNGTICCFRSHIAAMDHFKNEDIDYLLILEDDASLHIQFTTKLLEIINTWKGHPDLDCIYLGYNLGLNINEILDKYHNDHQLFYDIHPYNQIWGCQGVIYKKSTLHHLCSVLHQPTTTLVRQSVKQFMDQQKNYCNKYPRLQSDALIPLCTKFGLYYPPLVIEKQGLESNIEHRTNDNINKNHHIHSQIQFQLYL